MKLKTQIVMKKGKLLSNSKKQIDMKLKKSNCDETKKFKW